MCWECELGRNEGKGWKRDRDAAAYRADCEKEKRIESRCYVEDILRVWHVHRMCWRGEVLSDVPLMQIVLIYSDWRRASVCCTRLVFEVKSICSWRLMKICRDCRIIECAHVVYNWLMCIDQSIVSNEQLLGAKTDEFIQL